MRTVLFVLFLVSTGFSARFTFKSTSRVSTSDNWLNEDIPCHGDNIRFDNTLPVVAFMDHNVNAETIVLPENGMIYFSDNGVEFGGETHWQCEKTDDRGQRDAFFTRDANYDTSFYSPKSWTRDDVDTPLLHMNQVPSEYDDVVVSSLSSAQIYVDLPIVVNTFQWYKRYTMTTEDFNVLIRSMEGQFQLQLSRPWATESDLGGVQRMVAVDPITVKNKRLSSVRGGRVNPNSENATLSTICSYVKCKEDHASQCIQSFVPFGHCCPICGGKIELIAWDLDFELAKQKVANIVNEVDGNEKSVEVGFERKTVDAFNSKYEVVIALKPDHHFNEEFYDIVTHRIVNDLAINFQTHSHKSILDFTIHLSKVDRTIKTLSKVVACLIYFTILIALIAGYVHRNVEVHIFRHNLLNPVVRYKRQNDDVAIELDDVTEEPVAGRSEEDVGDVLNINPNYEFNGQCEHSDGIELSQFQHSQIDESTDESIELSRVPRRNSSIVLPLGDDITEDVPGDNTDSTATDSVESGDSQPECSVENLVDINPNFAPGPVIVDSPAGETISSEIEEAADTITSEDSQVPSDEATLIDF